MLRLIAGFALLVLASAAPAPAQTLTNAQIVRFFDLVALGNELEKVADPRVYKWSGPIRYFVDEQVRLDAPIRGDLDRQLAKLSALTKLRFERVGKRQDANFLIVFTTLDRFGDSIVSSTDPQRQRHLQRLARANCVGVYKVLPSSNAIVSATVVIPVDHVMSRGLMHRCIVEETTQVMGLPNDDDEVEPSIFNDRARRDELTWLDELLLRMLYNPRMTTGLRRADALAVARQIVPELRRAVGR
ncbi:MAG: DUF2927 domain-containing protein [Alphaproteobacteria bacterium]